MFSATHCINAKHREGNPEISSEESRINARGPQRHPLQNRSYGVFLMAQFWNCFMQINASLAKFLLRNVVFSKHR